MSEFSHKTIQTTEEGTQALLSGAGIKIEIVGATDSQDVTYLSDNEWDKAIKSLPTHDIVVDNETKTLKYVKRKQVNK